MSPTSPLRRYNPLSVLRNINLADVDEINKTMHYLARCLDKSGNIAGSRRIAEQAMVMIDKGPVHRIVTAIERNTDYPLLKMAVERLLEARDRSRLEILGAISEIEHLAEEKVLINPTVWFNEYVEALDRFLELPPLQFVELPLHKRNSKDEWSPTTRSKRFLSGETVVAQSPEQFNTENSAECSPNNPKIESKPVPKRLPSHASANLSISNVPNSKIPRTKASPSTPRRKRPEPISHEHTLSSTPEATSTTPKKRGKSPKACNECRRRKIKCLKDDGDESCISCFKLGRDCIFSPPSSTKSAVRGSLKRTATEDLVETPVKKRASNGNSKITMKNILHEFDDIKEGQALGIISDADDEDSGRSTEESAEVLEVSKDLPFPSDPEDFEYNPNKRVRRGRREGSKSIRKQSAPVAE
ncbi:hypothetical protein ONS95_014140 [Cadophora gregata]|uniref:uncharacterized protein n=1 Tax=Cadophora gregata TaxID=51156 RepID=UPI0026DADB42|nr:uncharacterized protein ONS95_014140 [Cadophora gregata]KAK0114655.1 hypothetical protein ONS95_014140 [Cadophora gregata]